MKSGWTPAYSHATIAPIDDRLAFLVADDRKAKPARFDVGRKLFELVTGEHRKLARRSDGRPGRRPPWPRGANSHGKPE
jgi:hypothetical protein